MASFVMPLLLSAIIIWFFYAYQKKKHQSETEAKDALLREQALIIQSQTAVEKERSRIAAEMHDDLGSGLTTIKYLSDKALTTARDENEKAEIKKIGKHSNDLVRSMGEIIWAMNTRFDNAVNLIGYIRRYAAEYLEEQNMDFSFKDNTAELHVEMNGEKRRNVFLIVKEVLHNAVKYSGAGKIEISVAIMGGLAIAIHEVGGQGFEAADARDKGNGLYNMGKRIEGIGSIAYAKSADGMTTTIHINIT